MLVLAACSGRSPGQQSANPPFVSTPIADFNSPWALAFLPGTSRALVTEKRGRIWLVDIATGAKQEISGVPKVRAGGQGGLLDIALSPRFASDHLVYLSYSEPSPESGSGLALARARLSGTGLNGLQLIWRDPQGGSGGQFGGIIAFAPDGNSLFLSYGRPPALHPGTERRPAARQNPAPDARRKARIQQPGLGAGRSVPDGT